MPNYNRTPAAKEKALGLFLVVLLGAHALASCGDPVAAQKLTAGRQTSAATTVPPVTHVLSPKAYGCDGNTKPYGALVGNAAFAGIDQGVDFTPSTKAGYDICAPASGVITLADQTGHTYDNTKGAAEVVEKLDSAPNTPNSSPYIYFAEFVQIAPYIHLGTHVRAGEVIGSNNQGPGIEVGWAYDAQGTYWLCSEAEMTPCGKSFDAWVRNQPLQADQPRTAR
ncbi:MAG TPA: hypothetical protein VFT53_06035 [Candidatus Saccharimonadales bacterium]|nr:hypothetical protein [Candidatus Saccharimonadales bacterium]